MNLFDNEEYLKELEEVNRQYRERRRAEALRIKNIFDPARDLNPTQLGTLLRWADTLHYYRQLLESTQKQTQRGLAVYEQEVRITLNDISIGIIRNITRRNLAPGQTGVVGESHVLSFGSILTDQFFIVDQSSVDAGRFGYEFFLNKTGQNQKLVVFFHGGEPLTDQTRLDIEKESFEPTSVVDISSRKFQPYRIFNQFAF